MSLPSSIEKNDVALDVIRATMEDNLMYFRNCTVYTVNSDSNKYILNFNGYIQMQYVINNNLTRILLNALRDRSAQFSNVEISVVRRHDGRNSTFAFRLTIEEPLYNFDTALDILKQRCKEHDLEFDRLVLNSDMHNSEFHLSYNVEENHYTTQHFHTTTVCAFTEHFEKQLQETFKAPYIIVRCYLYGYR